MNSVTKGWNWVILGTDIGFLLDFYHVQLFHNSNDTILKRQSTNARNNRGFNVSDIKIPLLFVFVEGNFSFLLKKPEN